MKGLFDDGMNTPRVWLIDLAACAATGVLLGVVGPFGSFFNDDLPVRIVYWTIVFLISGVMLGLAMRWALLRARRAKASPWMWVPAVVLIVSLAPALASRLIAVGLWPEIRQAVGPVEWYGQAVLICSIYVGLHVLLWRKGLAVERAAPATVTRQLSKRIDRNLICMQMEDHYVRVHTAAASELVLMPLSQAIADLDGIEGLQVHRSWWVAKAAVTGVVEDGRNLRLRLAGGLSAPVSRARISRLRAEGWI